MLYPQINPFFVYHTISTFSSHPTRNIHSLRTPLRSLLVMDLFSTNPICFSNHASCVSAKNRGKYTANNQTGYVIEVQSTKSAHPMQRLCATWVSLEGRGTFILHFGADVIVPSDKPFWLFSYSCSSKGWRLWRWLVDCRTKTSPTLASHAS